MNNNYNKNEIRSLNRWVLVAGCIMLTLFTNNVNAQCTGTPSPAGTASALPSTVCSGGTSALSLAGYDTNTGITLQWQSSSTTMASGGTYANVSGGIGATTDAYTSGALSSTTYFTVLLTCTNTSDTVRSNEISVTVNPLPAVPTISTSTTPVCAPATITFTSSYAGSGNVWSPGGSTADNVVASGAGSYSYTVTYTDGNGCSATSAPATGVINTNSVSIFPSNGGNLCPGGSVTLTSSLASGNTWSTTEVTQSIIVTTSGTYSVTNTDGNGCVATANYTVNNANSPTASVSASCTTLLAGNSSTLTATATAGSGTISTYQWVLNGSTNVGINSSTYSTSTAGSYTVRVTNSAGCSFTSAAVVLQNTSPLSGAYTIGGAAACNNYSSMANAALDLNGRGVSGNVTFTFGAAYTETAPAGGIVFSYCGIAANLKPSASQTVTFTGPATINAPTGTSSTLVSGDGIIKLVGADYFTFNQVNVTDLNLASATTQMEWGYALLKCDGNNGSNFNTINNCTITLKKTNTNSTGIYAGNHNAAGTTAVFTGATSSSLAVVDSSRNGHNVFTGNTISNVYTGVLLNGNSASAGGTPPYSLNDTLNEVGRNGAGLGNSITNFGGALTGVFAITETNQRGMKVNNNTINGGAASTGAVTGISMTSGAWGEVTNNTLTLASSATTSTMTGITVGFFGGDAGNPNIVTITGNTVQNIAYSTSTSAALTAIASTAGGTGSIVTVSSNNVLNNSLSGTGTFTGITNTGAPLSLTLSSNNFTGNAKLSTGTMTGITFGSPTNATVNSNNVSNNAITGGAATCTFNGMVGSTSIYTLSGNTISNDSIKSMSGTSTATITGYSDAGSATSETITNNIIRKLSISGTSTGGHAIRGIVNNTLSSTTRTVSGNRIDSLYSNAASSCSITGIISTAGGTVSISKNFICGLYPGQSTGTSFAKGISNTSGTAITISNNIVNVDVSAGAAVLTGSNSIVGVEVTAGTNVNIYFNTIRCAGNGSGTAFGSSGISLTSTTPIVDIRNNIVSNLTGAGGLAAANSAIGLRRTLVAATGYASTSNNNIWYAGTPSASHLLYWDGVSAAGSQTITAFRLAAGSPRETVSKTENVAFVATTCNNANCLKIDPAFATNVEGGAQALAGITTDFFGTTRNGTAPDIGAHEGNFINLNTIITSAAANPASGACTAQIHHVTATVVAGTSAVTGVSLAYAFNGVAGAGSPVAMTNTSGNIWEGDIPAATPTNANVTWTVSATDLTPATVTASGLAYKDNYLLGTPFTATVTPSSICLGTSTALASVIGGPQTAPVGYAASNATNTADEEILNVTFGSLNNTSICGAVAPGPGSTAFMYSNYTSGAGAPAVPTVQAGQVVPFSVQIGTCGGNFTNHFTIYIDFNRNGLLSDAGEMVYNDVAVSGPHTISGTITIPTSTSLGVTLLRVIETETTTSPLPPTGTYTWGETEDYLINIVGGLGYTFSWSNGASTIASTQNGSYTPTVAGPYTYTVTATDPNGCTLTASVPVTVLALPAAPTAVISPSTQCGLAVPTCSVSGSGGSFAWYLTPTGGTAIAGEVGTSLTTYSISTTTTFYVAEFDGSCQSTRTMVIANVQSPTATVASNTAANPTCPFINFDLVATGGGYTSFTWTASPAAGSGIPVSTTGNPKTIQATAGGTYIYTVTATDGVCSTTSSTSVIVSVPPNIDSIKAVPNTVCAGSTVALSVYSSGLGSGPQVMPTGYLASNATNTADEEIHAVQIGTGGSLLNQTSTCATTGGPAANGLPASALSFYSNYTAITAATTLTAGNSYPISLSLGYCNVTSYSNMAAIYIDLNRNGTFDLPAEQLFTKAYGVPVGSVSGSDGTATGTITIPLTAVGGITLMRVVYVESSVISPTGTYTWGETEDYSINMIGVARQDPAKTYVWNPGSLPGATVSVNPLTTTTYTVAVNLTGNACTNYSTVLVTVNPLPAAPSNNDGAQCGVGVPTCTVSGNGGTFRWYLAPTGGSPLPGESLDHLVSYSIGVSQFFYVSEFDGLCESDRTAVYEDVFNPDAVAAHASTPTCLNEVVNLTVTKAAGGNVYVYNWTATPLAGSGLSGSTPGAVTDGHLDVTPTVAGTYTYTVSGYDANTLCSAQNSVTITVTGHPVIDSLRASASFVCAGSPVTLNAYSSVIGTGPQTQPTGYPGLTTSPGIAADEQIFGVTFGTMVNNQVETCASNYTNYTGTITAPTVIAGNSVPFQVRENECDGPTLYANGLSIYIDYNRDGDWLDAGEQAYTSGVTAAATGVSPGGDLVRTGSITIPLTASSGVTRMRVIVAEGVASPTSIQAFSYGEQEDYIINIMNVVPVNPGLNYSWNPGSVSGSTVTVNPTVNTTYTATVTNPASGCSATGTVAVSVIALPSAPTASAPSTQCGYGIPTCSVTGSGGTFRWYLTPTGGTALAGETGSALSAYSISATTTFYVSEYDGACEGARAMVIANVTQPDAITASTIPSGTGCTNNPLTLNVAQTGNTNTYSYAWTASPLSGSGLSGSTPGDAIDGHYTATPTGTGSFTYTVIGTDVSAGCVAASTVTITILESPVISVTPVSTTVCPGTPTQLNVNPPFGAGYAYSFNGTNQYIAVPQSGSLDLTSAAGNSITLEAWVNVTAYPTVAPGDAGIISHYQSSSAASYFLRTNEVSPYSGLGAGASTANVTGNGVMPLATWTHVAAVFTYNPSTLNDSVVIYKNGVRVSTPGGVTVIPHTNDSLRIASDFGARYFKGVIDEVRIWSAALSPATLIAWSTQSVTAAHPNYASLRAYYSFNNLSSTTVTDQSGNGNTGYLRNGPTQILSGIPLSNATTYSWSPATGLSSTTIANPIATVSSLTTYTVTVTAPNGCPTTGTSTINVFTTSPAPTASAPSTQCGIGVPSCSVTGSGGSFRWYLVPTGGTAIAGESGTSLVAYSISATTTFYVSEYDGVCESPRAMVIANVIAPDALTLTPSASPVCGNSSLTLTSAQTGSTNVYVYSWSATPLAGSGLSGTETTSSVTITPTVGGSYNYTVTGTDASTNCVTSSTTTVSVTAPPPIVTTVDPTTVCSGTPSTLTAASQIIGQGPQVAPTGYCVVTNAGSSCVTNVQINTLNNNPPTCVSPYYHVNAPVGSATTTLTAGQSYTMTLTTGGTSIISVWIDYNRDGIYAASEWVQPWISATTGTVTISVPLSASPGLTGMRVRSRLNGNINGAVDACLAMGSGSTEDYTINIQSLVDIPGVNFTWQPGTLSGSVQTVTPSATTVYTVTANQASTGCTSTATVTVNVASITATPIAIANPTAICGSGTTALSLSVTEVGLTYTWQSSPSGLINTWSTIGSGASLTSGTITSSNYFRVYASCGTIGDTSASVLVTVSNPSVASTTGGSRCGPGSVTLSVTGTGSFDWYAGSTGGTALATNTASYTANYLNTTTLWVQAYIGTCLDPAGRQPVTATINSGPAVSVATAPGTTICAGTQLTLTATSINDPSYTYNWSTDGITSVHTGATYVVTPSASTVYYVLAQDNTAGPNAGCSAVVATSITVNPVPPTPVISPASPAICATGGCVNLSVQGATVSAPGPVYIGDPATALASTTTGYPAPYGQFYTGDRSQILVLASEMTAQGMVAGNITQLTFDVVAPPGPATVGAFTNGQLQNFTIKLGPTPLAALTTTFESGLTQVYTVANYTAAAGLNTHTFNTPFLWDGVSNIIVETCYINDNGTCPTGSTNYGTNATHKYTVTPFVSVIDAHADGSCTVCGTATGTTYSNRPNIQFTGITGSPITYTWNPGSIVGPSTNVCPTATTTYTVVASLATGCTSSASTTVVYDPIATPVIATPASICQGGSASLDAGTGYTNYSWSNGATTQINSVSPASTTTYTVTVSNGGVCTATASVTVTVAPLAPPTITSSNGTTFCSGSSTTLNAGSYASWLWSTTATTQSISANSTGTYTVTVTATNGCTATSSIALTVNPAPPTASVSPAGPINLCDDGSNSPVTLSADTTGAGAGSSIAWNDIGGETGNNLLVDNNSLDLLINGNTFAYGFTVTNSFGCQASSNLVTVNIVPCNASVTLNATMYLEGYYAASNTGLMDNYGTGGCLFLNGSSTNPLDADTVEISMMDAATYALVDAQKGILKVNGTVSVTFSPSVTAGTSYYIRVKHRSAVQTWSANPVLAAAVTSYNFSTAPTQAYGSNMVQTTDMLYWAFYSGDISDAGSASVGIQDEVIESQDYSDMENAVFITLSGYVTEDITGDLVVESLDYSIMENNVFFVIQSLHP